MISRASLPGALISHLFQSTRSFSKESYAKRYELVCERLVRERLYDAVCFFTSNAKNGMQGIYAQPSMELSIRNFAKIGRAHV